MKTYIQDEFIPIYISLQYGKNFIKFPINPDCLRKNIPSDSTTADVEGIGEVSIPTTPKLATISIKSFFWHNVNYQSPSLYVAWLEKWQKSKQPAKLIVTRLNYSMSVTCESFNHWINAGEESDIYFELNLKEYRPYGAKKLNVINNSSLFESLSEIKDKILGYTPILIDLPRPSRHSNTKDFLENTYIAKKGENIISITKKLKNETSNWKSLYDNNKEILSDLISSDEEIPEGTKLNIPKDWIGG